MKVSSNISAVREQFWWISRTNIWTDSISANKCTILHITCFAISLLLHVSAQSPYSGSLH